MTPPPAYLLQVLQCSFTHIQFSPNIQLLTVAESTLHIWLLLFVLVIYRLHVLLSLSVILLEVRKPDCLVLINILHIGSSDHLLSDHLKAPWYCLVHFVYHWKGLVTYSIPMDQYRSRRLPPKETQNFWDIEYRSRRIVKYPEASQPSSSNAPLKKRKRKGPLPNNDPDSTLGSFMEQRFMGKSFPTSPFTLGDPTFCTSCGAKHFAYESKLSCCGDGIVKIAANEYPLQLIELFTSDSEIGIHFRKYCRLYNNMFAFSSLGGSIDARTHKGIYVFKVHGQLYHYVPDLLPKEAEKPKFLQLYFFDGQFEKEHRSGIFPELNPIVVSLLMEITDRNPYAHFFRSLRHIDVHHNTRVILNKNPCLDQRLYNAPTSDEVAAIWIDDLPSNETRSPYIVVWGKSSISHRIFHYYGCYDPLQYPLLFPNGDCGWHQGLRKASYDHRTSRNRTRNPISPNLANTAEELLLDEAIVAADGFKDRQQRLSCREYYAYRLQIRPHNYLVRAGRLFQQFVVDMYIKIENTRLDFVRHNQSQLRAELYEGIMDSMNNGDFCAKNIGHRIILPPSFIGGPRDMKKRYLNAMALLQRYGKPDIFLTITCNANWAEIKQELAEGELAQDRPDLVSRIFRAKLVTLKKIIREKKFFGEVAAMIHVIEFQKRGLPHAHFLIILQPQSKITQPQQFDQFVCAEIPAPSYQYLRGLVLRHMMHGPCGSFNPECPCMVKRDGKLMCRYKYPREFTTFTTHSDDGYPTYMRRDTSESIRIRGVDLDNRWVIPYNPYLLAAFDCHINVEVCSTIKAVKYLYKYVYKGHDKISLSIGSKDEPHVIDEIERFQSGRWVSPPEAAWRIFSFDLYDMQPAVLPLQVHLPNKQSVCFNTSENLAHVMQSESRTKTVLTEFFSYNASHPSEPKYCFPEFAEHHVWHAQSKSWNKRKRSKVIGRLAFVAPSEGERYYLRLLLARVVGPRSFDDLLTVNNQRCSTFHEAALKRGFVEPDNLIEQCLNEAIEVQMPHALRRLFATVLVFMEPVSPVQLWDHYYPYLSEDYALKHPNEPHKVLSRTARSFEVFLENMGKTLVDYGLQHLYRDTDMAFQRTRDIVDALDAPIPASCMEARSLLNVEQRAAYKRIIYHVKQGMPGLFFIDGPGGTGKTFLYNALYAKVRLLGKIVLPTATSGIAASNMPTGRTAHSRFKIPNDCGQYMSCNVGKQSSLAALIKEAALIIWDEASMARRENIESLDLLLRDLCLPSAPFGGKIVVLGGDFRQTVPVVPKKTQHEIIEYSLVCSPLWDFFTRLRLTENIRAREDPTFSDYLLALGNGELQTEESELITIPSTFRLQCGESAACMDDLLQQVYPQIATSSATPELFTERAILTPRNEDVDIINSRLIESFCGDVYCYKSFDTVIDDCNNIYPTEFLNTLCPGGMSPHELILKLNCPVILLRNLDPSSGLCNGTRLICKKFMPNLIQCQIATGFSKGELVLLPRITLRAPESSEYPFQFQRMQFPIKLCFAMTINKSQGQTLQEVGVYIRQPCFSHGQLYVAFSRARKASKIWVLDENSQKDCSQPPCTTNVVSYDLLKKAGIIPGRRL